jgi:hypothetical protein
MRTRHSSSLSKSKRKPFRHSIFESLEPRRLLTTFTHTVGQAPTSFFYYDEFGNFDRVSFFGNITAELIGAQGGGGGLINLPAFPAIPVPPVNPLDSLFAIYVSQSDFTGGITISQVPSSNFSVTDPTDLAAIPFANTIGNISVTNAQSGAFNEVAAPGGSGEALLGAVTNPAAQGFPSQPVLQLPVNQAFGVLPANITELSAGLTVAAGQNLGNFYIGGTVMGQVHLGGAINNFYAGWLLTGNANGEFGVNNVTTPQNFTVAGDIQNLLVGTSIGTDSDTGLTAPTYNSGFDMFVNGTIGTVHAFGSILGSINAANTPGVPNNGADQGAFDVNNQQGGTDTLDGLGALGNGENTSQIENINKTGNFDFFLNDYLGGNANFQNDSFATAQYISNNYNAQAGTDNSVIVDGVIQDDASSADNLDYYAVPLLAGQTITVQVQDYAIPAGATGVNASASPTNQNDLDVGVFDPDGREIASDYNLNSGGTPTGRNPMQEQPFQFTADRPGVYRFAVAPSGDSLFAGTSGVVGDLPYVLSISNVGHMAIGSIVAANNICDSRDSNNNAAGFGTQNGDLGAIVSGGTFVSADSDSIAVENGNLRAVTAVTIGNDGAGGDPQIACPNGNVGLVESTGGDLSINDNGGTPAAIGGDYELVSSAGNFIGNLIANGNIGTVRAQSITNAAATAFQVNAANNSNFAGHIDLIDDAGDFGNGGSGGPSIKVGPDGVLTYLHVLGTVFGNSAFGQVQSGTTNTYPASTAVPIVESSGAVVTLTPVVSTTAPAPVLTVTTYPLDDGGAAIVNVTSTGGLTVQGSGSSPNQEFGIGEIDLQGIGNTPNAGLSNLTQHFAGHNTVTILSPPTVPNNVIPVDMTISGSVGIGVLDLVGTAIDQVANSTPGGEIVNINAASIGTLGGSDPVGCNLIHSTAAALLPNDVLLNTFPFNGQRTGVVVTGDIVNISLPDVGNISAGGTIGTITGTISAPVLATGNINNVVLGSGGILPSGSGNLSYAGVYADGIIGNVVGINDDIRGTIASSTAIQSVHVQNGSIINANIGTYVSLTDSDNLRVVGTTSPTGGGTVQNPILSIGSIVTNGDGGIIGSWLQTASFGVVSARNGFGILGTLIDTVATGTVGSIYADGYGLRSDLVFGGFNIGSITANGDGSLDSTAIFSNQVRFSESDQFDPFFGVQPNTATDIDKFLSAESTTTPVDATTPVVAGVTDTGVIQGSSFLGSHTLSSVSAWSIRANPVTTTATTTVAETAALDAQAVTKFSFANSIGSIITTGPVDGMSIITGKLGTLRDNGDLADTSLTISGRINNLTVRANLTDNSSIIAHGRNGNIGTLNVLGNVAGLIEADGGRIGTVTVHGSLTGKIQTKNINKLVLFQNLGQGSLVITGSANIIQLMQDLGPQGNTLTVDGKVNTLKVGSNLTGNVDILGALGTLTVNGSIASGAKVTVSKVLGLLKVGADFQAGAIVQAHQVKKVSIRGANAGTISIV